MAIPPRSMWTEERRNVPLVNFSAGAGTTSSSGNIGIIRPGPPGAKEAFCQSQADNAALAKIIPGGDILFQHQFTPDAAAAAGIDVATDVGLDIAKDAAKTSILSWLKDSAGISGQTVGRIATALKVAGYVGSAYTAYQGLKAGQAEYTYCIK